MTDTPHLGHAPIPMRHVGPPPAETESCYDGFKLLEQRGDFYWQVHDGKRTLALALPCQRHRKDDGTAWVFSSWTIDHKNHCDAQWSWDGNEDQPTLDPSLHAVGIWHGWMRAGQ